MHIGVDIAKASFAGACWKNGSGSRWGAFTNDAEGFQELCKRVDAEREPDETVHLVLEPTGGYELALVLFAREQGWTVYLPNPARARAWAVSKGRRGKTDAMDALTLAQYGYEQKPHPQPEMPTRLQEMENLLRRKDDLERMLRQERNRQQSLGGRPGVPDAVTGSIDRVIEALEEDLEKIQEAIDEFMGQHEDLKAEARRLLTVPGVGEKNVLYILALLYRWSVLTQGKGQAKSLVALVGLDPKPYQSGTSVWKAASISRMGNREMRRRLYLSALGGIRGDNALRRFYDHLLEENKKKKVALVAAARKVLVWSWAVYRQGCAFDPTRVLPATA